MPSACHWTNRCSGMLWIGIICATPLVAAEPPAAVRYDVLIRNGQLVDGTGAPARRADIAIRAGRIEQVGRLTAAAADVSLDAQGLVVCPGFIDLHSHADRGILRHRAAENYVRQGVTTLLCGNCGGSPVNVAEFFRQVNAQGTGPNIALLIGHGSVREQVMGRANRKPTSAELARMQQLVRSAMQAGASGLSTSLRYGPGAYAAADEIVALADQVAPFGGFYATHMRDEGTRILEAIEEALVIGRKAGVPVHISHHKISSVSAFGLTRQTLARIDRARQAGHDVSLDQYPYGAGSGGVSLYAPQWSLAGGLDAFRKRIQDDSQLAAIHKGIKELLIRKLYHAGQNPEDLQATRAALSRIQIARAQHDERIEGQNLVQILSSREQQITLDNGCRLLIELISRGVRGINHTLDADAGGDVDRVMQHASTCIASDGSVFAFGEGHPHPRSYGCFPRVFAVYVRQRKLLSLEQAIHKMTALPAQRLGHRDRGRIAVGHWADIVVFNPQTIRDTASFTAPHQHAVGVQHVLVNGRFVLKSGSLTADRPGHSLSPPPVAQQP